MKQTAVEWLVKHLSERGYIQAPSFGHSIIDKAINQAKEMEKEQIMNAYNNGDNRSAELYYNETFNKIQLRTMNKEEAKDALIELLMNQVIDLTMMSKIELGDDVIAEIRRLKELINTTSI